MPHSDNPELESIAQRMLSDYDAATPGTIFSEGVRLSLSDAWRLQAAVTRLREARGERVIGYKIGCVFPGNQQMMGLSDRVWGSLWDSELHEDGVVLQKSNYDNLSLEAEFGVTLRDTIAPGASMDDIGRAIDALYPVLEMHNLTLRSEAPHGHELIANNCIHCGVVRGAPIADLESAAATDLQLVYDGSVVDSWQAVHWPQDILAAVGWLANRLDAQGARLKSGDLILTGAWGPPIPVQDSRRTELTSSAFGNVSATFT